MSTLERLEEYAAACREARDNGRKLPVIPDDLRDLRGADLRGADLSGASLRGANLRGADLSGANLRGVILSGVNLRWADLRGADLSGAILGRANLSGADLSWVILSGADLSGTIAQSVESKIYRCWRIGQYLAYGCETHPLRSWPLDEAAARHPNVHAAHAEVRAIVTRLISES